MLTVKNNGLDFPEVLDKNKGIGLKIMEYRADMINGSLKIYRSPNGGTIVTCMFPKK
jgi:signal transduction histidine kinase